MMKQMFLLASAVVLVAAHHHPDHAVPQKAIVKLCSPTGQDISGNVTFSQLADGKVQVQGSIIGLAKGEYGFHVHEKGDITGGCLSTGPHFNPEHKDHGHPGDDNRHVGDLGNVAFDENRVAKIDFADSLISLIGPYSIVGRGVVLHEKADDYGRSSHPDSKKTGNAGARVACGVVGILDPVYDWPNKATTSSLASAILLPVTAVVFLNY